MDMVAIIETQRGYRKRCPQSDKNRIRLKTSESDKGLGLGLGLGYGGGSGRSMEWRERSDLKTGTRGTRDGFLLVLVLVLVGGGYQPLCPFPRHRFVFPLKTASSSSQRETAKGSAVSCRVVSNQTHGGISLLFSYQDLVNPFHCPTLNLIIIY